MGGFLVYVTVVPLLFFSTLFLYQYRELPSTLLHYSKEITLQEQEDPTPNWDAFDGKRELTFRDMKQVEKVVKLQFESSGPDLKNVFVDHLNSFWTSNKKIKVFDQLTSPIFSFLTENYGGELNVNFINGVKLLILKMAVKSSPYWDSISFSGEGPAQDEEIMRLAVAPTKKCLYVTNVAQQDETFFNQSNIPKTPAAMFEQSSAENSIGESGKGETKMEEEVERGRIVSFARPGQVPLATLNEEETIKIVKEKGQKTGDKSKKKKNGKKPDHDRHKDDHKDKHVKIHPAAAHRRSKRMAEHGKKHDGKVQENFHRDDQFMRPKTRAHVRQEQKRFRPVSDNNIMENKKIKKNFNADEMKSFAESVVASFFQKSTPMDKESGADKHKKSNNKNLSHLDHGHDQGSRDNENIAALVFWYAYELFRSKCQSHLTIVENERLMRAFDNTVTRLISQFHYDPVGSRKLYKYIYSVILGVEDVERSLTALQRILTTENKITKHQFQVRKPFTNTPVKFPSSKMHTKS